MEVDGRSEPQIQHRIDQAAGGEIGGQFRHLPLHAGLYPSHVFVAAGFVACLETDLNEGGVHGGVGCIDGGEAGIDADVRDDHGQVTFRDGAAQEVFEAGDILFGFNQARAGGGFHVDDKLSGIRAGEKR